MTQLLFFKERKEKRGKIKFIFIDICITLIDHAILYIEQTGYALMHYVLTSSHT